MFEEVNEVREVNGVREVNEIREVNEDKERMEGPFYMISMTLLWVLVTVVVIHVVMDNRQPAKTMAWALIIFFLPLVGIVLYMFFGINHRRERLVNQRELDQLAKRSMLNFVEQQNLRVSDNHKQLVDLRFSFP